MLEGKTGIAVAGVIGFLLALAWCYYRQAQALYAQRNVISSGANAVDAVDDFVNQVRKL